MHGSTLSECWRNKKIQKAPATSKADRNFVKRWGKFSNPCSPDLMLLIMEQVFNKAQQLQTEIKTQEEEKIQKLVLIFLYKVFN